jgi:hypothetical protein
MTQQALNSLALYKNNNPSTIERALAIQKPSVVSELKEHFGVSDNHELAFRLSIGR